MRPRGGYVHPLELLRELWGILLVALLLIPQGGRRGLLLLLLELVREGGGGGNLVMLLLLGRELRVGLALGLAPALALAVVVVREGEHVECGLPGPGGVHGRQLLLLRLGRVKNHTTGLHMSDNPASLRLKVVLGPGAWCTVLSLYRH